MEAPLDSDTDEENDAEESAEQHGTSDAGAGISSREAELPLPLIDGPMRQQVMGILWANWEVRLRKAAPCIALLLSKLHCAACAAIC